MLLCRRRFFNFGFIAALLLAVALPLPGANWPALNPAELAATAPTLDPEAAAEILSYEARIDDTSRTETDWEVYQRVKVFTRAGVERYSVIDVPFVRGESWVRSIEARTIKPDGTIVTLNPKDIYEREVIRSSTVRVRVKSFAPPGLEPGAIVEYRCRTADSRSMPFFALAFNRDVPVHRSVYRFRPWGEFTLKLQAVFMNTASRKLTADSSGYYVFEETNVPASPDEPFQPPRSTIASTVLLYYTYDSVTTPEKYWKERSRWLFRLTKEEARASKEITQRAQQLTAGAASDDEKLQRLHNFCRTTITNRERRERVSDEPEGKIVSNESATKTLRTGRGTQADINTLFVALAGALGFDARLALANDRSYFPARRDLATPFIFTDRVGAVKRGEQWQLFDPGAAYLPPGVPDWRNADTHVLIADGAQERVVAVPGSPAEFSWRHRSARLEIREDGDLEGEVTMRYGGHYETAEKNDLERATAAEIATRLRSSLENTLKGVEVSDVKVRNGERSIEPLEISCRVHVPGFAERTGTRLFVQPSVFRRNAAPLFPQPVRRAAVLFPFRTSERDTVEIIVPEGFALEAGHSPGDLSLGQVGHYGVTIAWERSTRRLHYERTFTLHVIGFLPDRYDALRQVFDEIQNRDNHTLTFRNVAEGVANAPAAL